MTPEELIDLISQDENPKLEFKRDYQLNKNPPFNINQQEWNKHIHGQWNELIKDIIALANGNIGYQNRNGILIIGADDKKNPDGIRSLFDVSHLELTETQLLAKVNNCCQPPIPSLSIERVIFNNKTIIIISIPPSSYLHETNRPLKISKGYFDSEGAIKKYEDINIYSEYTAFIRRGEAVSPASWVERQELLKDKQFSVLAINENIKSEIIHNLTMLLIRSSDSNHDPYWFLERIKCRNELVYGKSVIITSEDLFKTIILFQTAMAASISISTNFLNQALLSTILMRFDEKDGTPIKSIYFDNLLKLQRVIFQFKNMSEISKTGYEFLSKHGSQIKPNNTILINCDDLILVLAFIYRYIDIITLSKSILKYIIDPSKGLIEPKLNPSSPDIVMNNEIETERVTEEEVLKWAFTN